MIKTEVLRCSESKHTFIGYSGSMKQARVRAARASSRIMGMGVRDPRYRLNLASCGGCRKGCRSTTTQHGDIITVDFFSLLHSAGVEM